MRTQQRPQQTPKQVMHEEKWWISHGPRAYVMAQVGTGPVALIFQIRRITGWKPGNTTPKTQGETVLCHLRSIETLEAKVGGTYNFTGTASDGRQVVAEYHPLPAGTMTFAPS